MAEKLIVFNLGDKGVNVDSNPLQVDNAELRKAQNAIGEGSALVNRPGLERFNTSAAAGSVLGGIGVPLINLRTGARFFYMGRGPVA